MDLFDTPITGPDLDVTLHRQLLGATEAERAFQELLATIPWRQEDIVMFGTATPQPRLTSWIGDPEAVYTYSGLTMQPEAWSPPLLAIKAAVEEFAGVAFNSLLANLYRNGQDGMGWHADDERELGPTPVIGSLSFGAARKFQLRRRDNHREKRELVLASGDLLVMSGRTQTFWQHQVPKTSRPVGPRINLTFRQIVPKR